MQEFLNFILIQKTSCDNRKFIMWGFPLRILFLNLCSKSDAQFEWIFPLVLFKLPIVFQVLRYYNIQNQSVYLCILQMLAVSS